MARSNIWIAVILIAVTGSVYGQSNRYIVFFKDKNGSPFTKKDSLAFLSPKALDRRTAQGISIDERDIPVNPAYLEGVRSLGITTYFATRWMNAVLIQCPVTDIAAVQALTFVSSVELVAPGVRLSPGGRKRSNAKEKKVNATDVTRVQREMIGLDAMHEAGNRGEGKLIAVLDAGFPGVDSAIPFQQLMEEDRIDQELSFDFIANSSDVFRYDNHGTQVLSILAAFREDVYVGGAYKANYALFVTEDADSEYRIEEYNWLFAAERADSAGVDIISSSLGYYDFDDASMNYATSDMDGKTTVVTRAAQWAADRGILIVCAAGNEGGVASWRIISAPADAVDVLAVANVSAQGQKSFTSSVGPSADGRIKPDVGALGQSVSIVFPNGNTGTASGTSVAAPLITSLVAGVWQRYPHLTNREVMDLIRKTASQANNPDNEIGYGIPNFRAIANYQERTGQEHPFEVYPNPITSDTLYVRPLDPEVTPYCSVELASSQGRIVLRNALSFSWLNRAGILDLSPLSAGFYILTVTSGQQRFTFKVVKR